MGHSISWIAVRGMPPEEVHDLLGIRATGDEEEIPELACTAATLPSGWHVVFYNTGCNAVDHYAAKLVASGVEAIACFVEERVMTSGATAWKDGKTTWMVSHHPERKKGLYDLAIAGEVPSALDSIATKLRAEQDAAGGEASEVDYIFDAPLELAESIVGYRHNKDHEEEPPWSICEILNPAPGPAHMAGAGKFGCFGVVAAIAALGLVLCLK